MDQCPPVLFIIFNRPDVTTRVFSRIREARPRKLYIAADGPRQDVPGESRRCEETRSCVASIDWPCEVRRLYADKNLGMREGELAAMNWVFEHEEQAIILEDDCLPDPSFFRFAGEMLERFRDDSRVMHISGSNFAPQACPADVSYFFSRHVICWGWASWRRAWRLYDSEMSAWSTLRNTDWLTMVLQDNAQVEYWRRRLDFILQHEVSLTWDYQWMFACWKENGLIVSPGVNLISNIGCGPEGTNLVDGGDWRADLPSHPMEFPLRHPAELRRCEAADRVVFKRVFLMRGRGAWHLLLRLRDRHFWGSLIRRIPWVGGAWARWRNRLKER